MSNTPNFPKPTPQNPAGQGPLLNEIQTEVSKEAEPFLQFLTTHALKIMGILAFFVLIVAGYGAYNWHQGSTLSAAQAELATLVLEKKGDERLAALEAFMKTAPKELQITTLLNMADGAMQDKAYEKAADFYGRIADQEKSSAMGILAAFNQGQALMSAGKAQDALPILEKLAEAVPNDQKSIIQQSIVEAALQSKNPAKAKATLEAMANAISGSEAELLRHRARNIALSAPAKAE